MKRLAVWVKERLAPYPREHLMVLNAVLFLFLPFPVGGMGTGLAAAFALARPKGYARVFSLRRQWPILAWAALAFWMTVRSGDGYALGTFVCFLLIVVFAALLRAYRTDELARASLALLVWCSIPACAVAALEILFHSEALAPDGRASSTVLNSNFYGYMCELIVVACVWALLSGLKPRRLFLLGAAVNVAGVALSGCRSAWPAMAAGVLLLLLLRGGKKTAVIFLCICGAVGAAVLVFPALIPHASGFDHSRYLREIIWAEAWRIFQSRPLFGGGFLTYQQFSVHAGEAYRVHAHNLYLDMLDNFGVVGVGLLALFCVPAIWRRVRALRTDRQAALFLAVLLATAVHGITDVPLLGTQSGPLAMLLLAL